MPDKTAKIMKAAEKLFAGGRFHEVTLDDICHEAGVGKGTVYRYFDGKEDLLYQVILAGMDDMVESVVEVGAADCGPAEGLREVAERMVGFYTHRESLFRLMHSEQLTCPKRRKNVWHKWRQKSDRIVDVITRFVVRGVSDGRYSDRLPPRTAARLLMSMLRGGHRNRGDMPGGKHWPSTVVDFFEKGLAAEAAGKSR